MPLIDERGRVFGRVNLIDGLVGFVVLLLIPLAYGAYVLFRLPDPTIISIEPAVVTEGDMPMVMLSGENLRPYLRASIGDTRSAGFLVQSPAMGAIKLPALVAGTYDVVLYDEVLEIARMPSALKVVKAARVPPRPVATIRVRFLVHPGLDKLVTLGDLDVGDALSRSRAERASLIAIDSERETMFGSVERSGYGLFRQPLTAFTGTIRVPLVQQPSGWRYKDARVKTGAPFTFETDSYVVDGWIVDAQIPSSIERIASDTENIVP